MDVAQALAELTELSSQVERAVVLDASGAVLGSTSPDERTTERLASGARDVVAAAGDLHPSAGKVTRVEIELGDGALFVLHEGGRTIAAVTRPHPTAGLVVYDLRTCLHALGEARRPKRTRRKPEGASE
jgi:predicted regulator of Ras-like GTPase activity (Roadblock/LC7/MglB family)